MFLPTLVKGFITVSRQVRVIDSQYSVYVLVIHHKANCKEEGNKQEAAFWGGDEKDGKNSQFIKLASCVQGCKKTHGL